MSDKPEISDLIGLSRLSKIPFWCFAVALELRPVLHYSATTDVGWLSYNLLHISHLRPDGHESEDYFAMRKRLDEILHGLAISAKSDEEIDYVLRHLGGIWGLADEAIGEKVMRTRTPDKFLHHEKSLKGRNAQRQVELDLATTEQDLVRLCGGIHAEFPHFDTVTEAASIKLAGMTRTLSTLKWIYDITIMNRMNVRFVVARRVYELWSTQTLIKE